MLFVIDQKPPPISAKRNAPAVAAFERGLADMRRGALVAARALLEIDRCAHFIYEGCASVGEFGERHGTSASEARSLVALARAIETNPPLELQILGGRISLHSAALLDQVLSNPSLVRMGDDWLRWAEVDSTNELRRRISRRREEARMDDGPAVAMTVFVTPKGRDDFSRARAIASRKADRPLTEGQALEAVVDHYLDSFDPLRKESGSRRLPHTSTVRGRYVPADVRRTLEARDGDRCALPFCDHEVFLENAHVVAHANGGHREADNLLRLCSKHHRMLDEGRLEVLGDPAHPSFADADGRPLDRRRTLDRRLQDLVREREAPT